MNQIAVKSTLSRRSFIAATLAAPFATPPRSAQANTVDWPNRPVRLVTLAAAGAGTDAIARVLSEALARRWGQPVIVDNRPGGDGIVSVETFLAARDGNHTLLFNPTGVWTALHLMHDKLSFDTRRDLVPLAFVAQDFLALAASPRLGLASLGEIVTAAQAKPGTMTWACAPSVPFLAFTAFLKSSGLDLTYVPYRNPMASLPDLAEGRVDLAFLPLQPLVGPAAAGKLKLLAVASDDRAPLAPDVPTAREAGYPALALTGGHCLFGPREMPEALCARIASDVRSTLAEATVAKRLTEMGYVPRPQSTEDFTLFLEKEYARWTEVAQANGVRPVQ